MSFAAQYFMIAFRWGFGSQCLPSMILRITASVEPMLLSQAAILGP